MNSLTNCLTWCLADIPAHGQVNLATGSFVEEQEEGGSERAQRNSGQGPRPPVAVGTWLRRLTAIFGLAQLREEEIHTQTHG